MQTSYAAKRNLPSRKQANVENERHDRERTENITISKYVAFEPFNILNGRASRTRRNRKKKENNRRSTHMLLAHNSPRYFPCRTHTQMEEEAARLDMCVCSGAKAAWIRWKRVKVRGSDSVNFSSGTITNGARALPKYGSNWRDKKEKTFRLSKFTSQNETHSPSAQVSKFTCLPPLRYSHTQLAQPESCGGRVNRLAWYRV